MSGITISTLSYHPINAVSHIPGSDTVLNMHGNFDLPINAVILKRGLGFLVCGTGIIFYGC
jgi:hypothetical protein